MLRKSVSVSKRKHVLQPKKQLAKSAKKKSLLNVHSATRSAKKLWNRPSSNAKGNKKQKNVVSSDVPRKLLQKHLSHRLAPLAGCLPTVEQALQKWSGDEVLLGLVDPGL